MSPKIKTSFWSDSEVENLSPEQKLTYLWLITNAQMRLCGICEVSEKRFSFETGLGKEHLAKTLQALPRALKHFPKQNLVYVRNYIRHQIGDGDQLIKNNIFKSVISSLTGVNYQEVRNEIASDYPLIKPFLSPSEGGSKVPKGERERKGEREGEGTRKGEGAELAEEIYQLYPKKVGHIDAIKAIMKSLLVKDSAYLRDRTKLFSDKTKGCDRQFVPHPATWFNDGRYDDDPEEWSRIGRNGNHQPNQNSLFIPGTGNL